MDTTKMAFMSSRNKDKFILGIETSCDETAASVLRPPKEVLSDVVSSQIDVHSHYGGVVPELASRHHLKNIVWVVDKALRDASVGLDDIGCVAVTQGPGLVGALVVGLSFGKAISATRGLALVGVNHVHAHLHAIFLEDVHIQYPYIGVIVSGGHTAIYIVRGELDYELLGQTRDDAAGEAFDKVAKVLGLPYPGGPIIGKLATQGDPNRFHFPRARLRATPYDFSFSGLKTSVINTIRSLQQSSPGDLPVADIAASFQEAVCDVIVDKALTASKDTGIGTIVLSGGVASNKRLRELFHERCKARGITFMVPERHLCTDNAAMIAALGARLWMHGKTIGLDADVYSRGV